MKGIVFTLDAVFAIMIATIAISILLYFNYAPVNQYNIKASSLNQFVYYLSTTNLGNFTASPLAAQMDNQYQGSQQTWPEFYQNNANNASNSNGPYTDSLLLVYNASSNIYPNSLLAGDRHIFFVDNSLDIFSFSYNPSLIRVPFYAHSYPSEYFNQPYNTLVNISKTNIVSDLLYQDIPIYANKTALVASGEWANVNAIPSSGIISSPMMAYDNIILVPIYVSGNATETGITGFYANNGTKAWAINTGGEVNSIAIVSGSIAAEVGNTVTVFSFQNHGTPFSLYSVTYPYTPTHMVVYNGAIHVADSATISGISVYNGTLFYQSVSDYTSATGNVNSGSWTTHMPSYVGTALSGGQPVASNGNLYTLWSNKYLVDQNPYDGSIKWILHIPYSGTLSPHMVLAYGELFVVVGNKLLGFGTCPGNPTQSILSNMVSLYQNSLSSCADILLGTANPLQNASIIVENPSVPGPGILTETNTYPYVMNFTGKKSVYANMGNSSALSPEAGPSGKMSLCTWYRINSLSGYHGPLIKGRSPPSSGNSWEYTLDQDGYVPGVHTHPSFTVWNPSGANIAFGEANAVTFNNILNSWSFACFTYDYPNQKAYYYFNGMQYAANIVTSNGPASAGTGSLIVGAGENYSNPTGKPGYSPVTVADLQIYNTILSSAQIKSLYDQGITASPVQNAGLVAWWPLGGDTNDYSGNGYTGFPYNISSIYSGYISPEYVNAYDIGVSKAAVTAQNSYIVPTLYGGYGLYGVYYGPSNLTYLAGVYSWR